MSIFDELLIVIDDQTEVSLDALMGYIPGRSRQSVGSVLGRLVGRKYIDKLIQADTEIFRITDIGNEYLDSVLKAISISEQPWDGSLFCVVCRAEGTLEQKTIFRRRLIDRGFASLINGFWVSPRQQDSLVTALIRDSKMGTNILTFKSQPFGKATREFLVNTLWKWSNIVNSLDDFIKKSSASLVNINKDNSGVYDRNLRIKARVTAKKMVFEYAQILLASPMLPIEFTPSAETFKKARELYQQIRQLCYY